MKVEDNELKAIAARIMDLAEEGKYAYEEGVAKSREQINIHREIKTDLKLLFDNIKSKRSGKMISDALLALDAPTRLRTENKSLRSRIKHFETTTGNYKELTNTLYRDELKEELKRELDQDREDALESSRRVNRKLMDTMEQLEKKSQKAQDSVSRQEWNDLRELNIQLNTQIVDMRKKVASNKKAEEILKIMKLVNSPSCESLPEEVYDEDA